MLTTDPINKSDRIPKREAELYSSILKFIEQAEQNHVGDGVSTSRPINQPTPRPINQPTPRSINQPINRNKKPKTNGAIS